MSCWPNGKAPDYGSFWTSFVASIFIRANILNIFSTVKTRICGLIITLRMILSNKHFFNAEALVSYLFDHHNSAASKSLSPFISFIYILLFRFVLYNACLLGGKLT